MKRCPKCNQEYHDDSLEFCLEDGARLLAPTKTKTTDQTVVLPTNFIEQSIETKVISSNATPQIESIKTTKVQELKEKAVNKGYQILEISPIVIALVHNYWQWLFADKQSTYSISEFLLSSSFIVWIILLIVGIGMSISTLKFGRNKHFAITSLIILAINFLLFIVPRR